MEKAYGQKYIPIPDESAPLNALQIAVWLFAWLALVVDMMDWQLVTVSASSILAEFKFPKSVMGLVLGAPLLGVGIGGLLSGWLADKFGRVRVMVSCLTWYSIFTVAFARANSFETMLFLRIMAGIGLGAQWGVGHTLVAEIMPSRVRIMCSAVVQTGFAFGALLAAFAAKMIMPDYGWRPLFYLGAIGFILAIIAAAAIPEPEAWLQRRHEAQQGLVKLGDIRRLFSPELRRRTICSFGLVWFTTLAYWGGTGWIPNWLVAERGLDIVKSMNYLMFLNVGGVIGYLVFALIADRWGRKPPAYVALVASFIAILIFVSIKSTTALLLFAPVYAFITFPIFGMYGGYLSELFPTEIRGTAVNGIYNLARMTAFFAPSVMGAIAAVTSMTFSIGLTALLYLASIIPLAFLPETVKKGGIWAVAAKSGTGS
ncbi:MFS transporter [Desulfofundulus thermocisternus]|uniref:MFS transporter n=1 Tax=Desulfofundulus thermocisternus TaxID=42471 RepID=UPI00217DB86C|nr:MFS transporter [Desulfofundulus thermocisternus]MCS5694715.1 MFS transporter [Desulfofundulus thermocisternus]